MDAAPPDRKPKSKWSQLKIVCVAGLVFLLLVLGFLCFVTLYSGRSFFSAKNAGNGDAFYRELAEFDAMLLNSDNFEKPEILNRALDKLTKSALGVESHLSILKRRRTLAYQDPRFLRAYQKAAQKAAGGISFSEPLAALAVESLVMDNPIITGETRESLRTYASRFSETKLQALALSLYILLGDMQDPIKAAAIPNKKALFSGLVPFPPQGEKAPDHKEAVPRDSGITITRDLARDLVVLQIFEGDIPGATAQINGMLQDAGVFSGKKGGAEKIRASNLEDLRFGAEFFYDYGNLLWAAELFSRFSDEKSMARQADALWLAGYIPSARNIWTILGSPEQSGQGGSGSSQGVKARSLYNLAVTAQDHAEEQAYLEQFLVQTSEIPDQLMKDPEQSYYSYGIIRYTRLLDPPQGIGILEKEQSRNNPLLDLELLRRQRELWPVNRTVAETWLLLNRYPEDPRVYQWGCYFFDFQRQYDETALLIKNATYRNLEGSWIELYDSLRLVREGQLEEGERRLKLIPPPDIIWQVPANIARILEARRAPVPALEYYEAAAALVKNNADAARIQFRRSLCLRSLGRDQESRQAMEQALEFDPDSLKPRLELHRLGARGIY